MIASIHQWKNEFVDNDVQICAVPVADHTAALTPHEFELVAAAVAIRQHTFSTGRYCAKTALSRIGIEQHHYPDGLLRKPDGSVAWPDGIIGSISHTNDWAMAALVRTDGNYKSIGIDIEKIDRVEKGVLRLIATEQERNDLEADNSLRWGRVALFSIKESLYKCLRPIYGEFIRFKDVELTELSRPLEVIDARKIPNELPALFCPKVRLLLPALASCCDEQRIEIRLAVLDSHVVSFVGYQQRSEQTGHPIS